MANIKNLQMWNTICADARISISKSFFGLRTTAVYNPTNSVLDTRVIELSPADGGHVKNILEQENISQAVGDFHPKPVANGNYIVEVCNSRDGEFLAIQLKQFIHMNYEPVTEVLIFEGNEAHAIMKMF